MKQRWRDFWFTPEPMYVLGLVRIVFGLLAFLWTLALLPDLYQLFGDHAAVPQQLSAPDRWGLFALWSGDRAVLTAWMVLLVATVALTAGWQSRIAAIIVFVLIRSFMVRDPWVFNGGDAVVAVVAIFLAVSSCGAALSLDQRRRTGAFWSAQSRAPWVIRLMQVQLSVIYLSTVLAKLIGKSWTDGTAASYAWQSQARWALFPVPQWVWDSPLLVNIATWGTLLIELALAVLVWNPRYRLRVLLAGVVLHLLIMLTMSVGFFSLAMFVLYLAFVPWENVERLPLYVRGGWARLRRRPATEVS